MHKTTQYPLLLLLSLAKTSGVHIYLFYGIVLFSLVMRVLALALVKMVTVAQLVEPRIVIRFALGWGPFGHPNFLSSLATPGGFFGLFLGPRRLFLPTSLP